MDVVYTPFCRRARTGYASEVPFDPKEAKNYNNPSESTEEDESRAIDHTSMKRTAISNRDVHWGGKNLKFHGMFLLVP